MIFEPYHIIGAFVIGIGASCMMDVWNILLKSAFGIPSLDYCLLGRWILYMRGGKFRHDNITIVQPKTYECPVGWVAHYSIGVAFALLLISVTSGDWFESPTLLPALLCGIGTVVFPWFLMQPALGLGVASSKTPNPTQARLKSLMTHTVFGVGLYVCGLAVSSLMHARDTREITNTVTLILSIAWPVSEIALGVVKRSRVSHNELDKSSLRLLWIAISISISVGVFFRYMHILRFDRFADAAPILGNILIVCGIAIRWYAILTLKEHFTVDVSIRSEHHLVKDGLYKYIRHPAYTGSLLSFLGLGIVFGNYLSLVAVFVPICVAFLYRIRVEEKALIGAFGGEYLDYRASTKALVPGLL